MSFKVSDIQKDVQNLKSFSMWMKWTIVAIVSATAMTAGCMALSDTLVDKIYKNILDDGIWQPPTVAESIESSGASKLTLGGRGEGLSCSIDFPATLFLANDDLSVSFRQACVYHDYCYRHGAATYGLTQGQCDDQLQKHAFELCRYVYEGKEELQMGCQREAKKVLMGVRLGGAAS